MTKQIWCDTLTTEQRFITLLAMCNKCHFLIFTRWYIVKLMIEVWDYFWYVTVTKLHTFTTRAIVNTSKDINVVLFLLVGPLSRSAD